MEPLKSAGYQAEYRRLWAVPDMLLTVMQRA